MDFSVARFSIFFAAMFVLIEDFSTCFFKIFKFVSFFWSFVCSGGRRIIGSQTINGWRTHIALEEIMEIFFLQEISKNNFNKLLVEVYWRTHIALEEIIKKFETFFLVEIYWRKLS